MCGLITVQFKKATTYQRKTKNKQPALQPPLATSEGPIIELLGVESCELAGRRSVPTPNNYIDNRHLRFLKIDRWKTTFETGAPENQGNRPSVGRFQEMFA